MRTQTLKILFLSVLAWIGAFIIITGILELIPPLTAVADFAWKIILGSVLITVAVLLGYQKKRY